jgi:alpha-L-fucosidase
MPETVTWTKNIPKKRGKMKLLQTGETVRWEVEGDRVKVIVPASVRKLKNYPALAFTYTPN